MGRSSRQAREGCICDAGEPGADPISRQDAAGSLLWLPRSLGFSMPRFYSLNPVFALDPALCRKPPHVTAPGTKNLVQFPAHCPLQWLEASGDSAETNPLQAGQSQPLYSSPPPHFCPELAREAGRGEGLLLRRDVHQPAPARYSPGTWDSDPPWLLETWIS